MYKLVLKITKETWGKCGITTVKHYNQKENMIELWQKMSDVKRQTGHLNIADAALSRIKKYCSKKTKDIKKKKKKNTKHFLKVKRMFLLLKNYKLIVL